MGRKSIREDKNIYQVLREELNLTRAKAVEDSFISESRLEKIETNKVNIAPDEVVELAKIYKKPSLCNHYCSNDCPIGIGNIKEVTSKDLSSITLETLSLLNKLDKQKDRLIEISADGIVDETESDDFKKIKKDLDDMSDVIESLKLWISEKEIK